MTAQLVCSFVAIASLVAAAQETVQRFQSRADLVAVDVLVMDGNRPVTDLRAADFELRDNDVLQVIEQLQIEQLPLNVILVLDSSWSVEGDRLVSLKKAALSVIERLRGGDRAAIVGFSHRLEFRSALTGDKSRLREAVDALKADGSTALRDAAYAGLALRGTDPGRALMLLFSDGVDTASFLEERQVVDVARRSDVTVYPIGIREEDQWIRRGSRWVSVQAPAAPFDDRFLKALAGETGGRLVIAEHDRDLGPTFGRVLDEFSRRYVLGYAPAGVSRVGWHRIDVKLKNRKGTVTARRGYFER